MKGPLRKVHYFISPYTDPYFNLALEDYIFRNYPLAQESFFFLLYRNRASVVIGHFQNPWRECHLELMAKDFVPLVRRMSGGGAVYHDLGNINYSIINNRKEYNPHFNETFIFETLKRLGVKGEIVINPERKDYFINGKKISGSAFKNIKDKSYHHGTLLVSSNIEKLVQYLDSPMREKIKGKSVPSKISPVTSLNLERKSQGDAPYLVEEVVTEIMRHLQEKVPEIEKIFFEEESLMKDKNFLSCYNLLKSYDYIWNEATTS